MDLEKFLYAKAEGIVKILKEYTYDKDGNILSTKGKDHFFQSDKKCLFR